MNTVKTKRSKFKIRKNPPTRYGKRVWRILPRTVIGISAWLVMLAFGAFLSAAVLYLRFDYSLEQTRNITQEAINEFTEENRAFGEDLEVKKESLDNILDNFTESVADPATIGTLSTGLSNTVVEVRTEDELGNTLVLTGVVFNVDASTNQSFILTSSTLLEAAKALPAPAIRVSYGDGTSFAKLETWDNDKDLALLSIDGVQLEAAQWASISSRASSWGDVSYVASGYSSQGVLIVPSRVLDYSETSVRFHGPVSNEQNGGALLNSSGEVIGVVTKYWNPVGLDSPHLPFAATRETICASPIAEC